jgi:hypothetical protein
MPSKKIESLLADFVATAFAAVGLDWREHVVIDDSLLRPTDFAVGRGNPNTVRLMILSAVETAACDAKSAFAD